MTESFAQLFEESLNETHELEKFVDLFNNRLIISMIYEYELNPYIL